jgi:hypothetical protein
MPQFFTVAARLFGAGEGTILPCLGGMRGGDDGMDRDLPRSVRTQVWPISAEKPPRPDILTLILGEDHGET